MWRVLSPRRRCSFLSPLAILPEEFRSEIEALRFGMKAARVYLRGPRKLAKRRLIDILERLALYCQAPDPQAKGSTDLHEAMKQFTWWPQNDLLKQLENSALTLAMTERKNPSRRIWKAFELVDTRMPTLHLLKHINELVERARERFTEANFSDLEALSWEWREDKDARNLLRDIDRIKENVSAARTIDWAQYKDILARFSDDGHVVHASGNDTALACYARVLELIVDNRRWGKLRKQSEALVFWLLEIGYPRVSGRDGLEQFNRAASFRWICEEGVKVQRKREAKWAKFQQSKRVIKKSKEDIEDDRLMELVRGENTHALATLRKRHEGRVKKFAKQILRSDSAVEDITQKVFIQVWKAAPEYVPAARLTTWLTEIAKNLALNEKNRAKKENERIEFAHIGADDSAEVNDGGDSEEDGALQALSQLSPVERRIIEARFLCERSKRKDRQALADELGITASRVEALEEEGLSKMRQFVDS
jgi:RNA polymerase sigma-70 factor, ECF subfamily